MGLTVHGLQSDQTGDKVVKVNGHISLCVAQDDQLEQVVVQLETWKLKKIKNKKSSRDWKCPWFLCFSLFKILKNTVPADSRANLIS